MKKFIYLLSVIFLGMTMMACQQQQSEKGEKEEKKPITYDKDKSKSDKSMRGKADDVPNSRYAFGDLPYNYDALKPVIDARTMKLHYDKHHKGYYKKFLKAIEGTDLQGKSITKIFASVSNYPAGIRNNSGGYYNHWLYWESMSPDGGGITEGKLMQTIKKSFGSFDNFKSQFSKAASGVFGSGWAWLIVNDNGKLEITNTRNQDNPVMKTTNVNGMPILGIDVWEHAYYIKYNNRRTDYIKNFWKVVDWKKAQKRFEDAQNGKVYKPSFS